MLYAQDGADTLGLSGLLWWKTTKIDIEFGYKVKIICSIFMIFSLEKQLTLDNKSNLQPWMDCTLGVLSQVKEWEKANSGDLQKYKIYVSMGQLCASYYRCDFDYLYEGNNSGQLGCESSSIQTIVITHLKLSPGMVWVGAL